MSWRTPALSFVLAAALGGPMASVAARDAGPAQQTGQAQPAPQQQRTVFRGGVNLVLVDAYPRSKDGRVVEGLGPDDFDVTEDGKPQKVEQFEFVRIEPVPESERRDPNNTRDMLQQAADPHNRVFVVYLDMHHVTVAGSHEIRLPLVSLLDHLLAPNDLFGVMTPKLPVTALVLGRKTTSIEDQLARNWPWGQAARLGNDPDDPEEDYIDSCAAQMGLNGTELKLRRRESRTLQSLSDLTTHLGNIREARSTVVIVTSGWLLFKPNQAAMNAAPSGGPPPITMTNGRLGTSNAGSGYVDASRCASLNLQLLSLDNEQRFRDLIDQAKKSNVVFYPINPEGLEAPNSMTGLPGITQRTDSLLTLADNTDGMAVVNTNDLNRGVARIATDLSAYYLIGYYSTNGKQDGRLRQIKVTVKEKDIKVSARRSYLAPSAADAAALSAAAAKSAASAVPAGMTEALGVLGRLDGSHGLSTRAVAEDGEVAVIAELADSELAKWAKGADVNVTVGEEGGTPLNATGHIDAGSRGVLVRVPVMAGTHTWQVTAKIAGDVDLVERISVRTAEVGVIGPTLVFRGTPAASSPLRPVADQLFRRTERVHLEWAIKKPLENRAVRLLDQRGQPIAVSVTTTERDVAGKPVLAADLNLAALSPADYVLELTATAGGATETKHLAIRVIR